MYLEQGRDSAPILFYGKLRWQGDFYMLLTVFGMDGRMAKAKAYYNELIMKGTV